MTADPDKHPSRQPVAVHEPTRRGGSIVLVLLVAAGIVATAVALMTLGRAQAQPYILGILAVLAMIGLFNLFAFAAGIIRFADRNLDDPIIARISEGKVLLDLRTVFDDQLPAIRSALATISKKSV